MTLTVVQLLQLLCNAPLDAEVHVAYDSGCAYSDAKSVEIDTEHNVVYISTEETE